MFGIIPGLITARLTGLLGGVVVAPFVMLFMVRYDAYRLPVRLSWFKAFLVSAISFLLLFGPLILPRTTALLRFFVCPRHAVPGTAVGGPLVRRSLRACMSGRFGGAGTVLQTGRVMVEHRVRRHI